MLEFFKTVFRSTLTNRKKELTYVKAKCKPSTETIHLFSYQSCKVDMLLVLEIRKPRSVKSCGSKVPGHTSGSFHCSIVTSIENLSIQFDGHQLSFQSCLSNICYHTLSPKDLSKLQEMISQ